MRIFKWLSRGAANPMSFSLPEALRLYVVGDIHGRADLLAKIGQKIAEDLRTTPIKNTATVFLGDYVDRGPASSAVLGRLASGEFPTEIVALKGNHELMLEDFLLDPQTGENWRQNGGLETLHSYGVDVAGLRAGRFEEAARAFRDALPPPHLAFIESTRRSLSVGDYFFCHAGIRPGVPLASQVEDDLLWIREPFLSSAEPLPAMIVHGHTPVLEPEIRPNRINIDTGAYITGKLTCLVLENEQSRFLFSGS